MTTGFLRARAARVKSWGFEVAERFAKGLFPNPFELLEVPEEPDQTIYWINKPELGLLSGILFTDGGRLSPASSCGLGGGASRSVWPPCLSGLRASASGGVPSAVVEGRRGLCH